MRLIVMASSNQAVNNIAKRVIKQVGEDEDILLFRYGSENIEAEIVRGCDPTNIEQKTRKVIETKRSNLGYHLNMSLANQVLKVAGLVETKNKKILKLRESHQELGVIMHKNVKERSLEERQALPK